MLMMVIPMIIINNKLKLNAGKGNYSALLLSEFKDIN